MPLRGSGNFFTVRCWIGSLSTKRTANDLPDFLHPMSRFSRLDKVQVHPLSRALQISCPLSSLFPDRPTFSRPPPIYYWIYGGRGKYSINHLLCIYHNRQRWPCSCWSVRLVICHPRRCRRPASSGTVIRNHKNDLGTAEEHIIGLYLILGLESQHILRSWFMIYCHLAQVSGYVYPFTSHTRLLWGGERVDWQSFSHCG